MTKNLFLVSHTCNSYHHQKWAASKSVVNSDSQDGLDTYGFAVSLLGKWEEQLSVAFPALSGQCCLFSAASAGPALVENSGMLFLHHKVILGGTDLGR